MGKEGGPHDCKCEWNSFGPVDTFHTGPGVLSLFVVYFPIIFVYLHNSIVCSLTFNAKIKGKMFGIDICNLLSGLQNSVIILFNALKPSEFNCSVTIIHKWLWNNEGGYGKILSAAQNILLGLHVATHLALGCEGPEKERALES